jgi:hypothetical protein
MKDLNTCTHPEIEANYMYAKACMNDSLVKRIYSWVCKECGKQGTEIEEIPSNDY